MTLVDVFTVRHFVSALAAAREGDRLRYGLRWGSDRSLNWYADIAAELGFVRLHYVRVPGGVTAPVAIRTAVPWDAQEWELWVAPPVSSVSDPDRESRIERAVAMLRDGASVRAIGIELGVSGHTAKRYLREAGL